MTSWPTVSVLTLGVGTKILPIEISVKKYSIDRLMIDKERVGSEKMC